MHAPADVLICGAGPAGSAAALAARRADPSARVVIVDRAAFPRDKVCGDGIGPHAGDVLAELGAAHVLEGYEEIRAYRFRGPAGHEVASASQRPGWVVPRLEFDARLLEAAVAAGAELVTHRVRSVRVEPDRATVDERLAARVLVGADGANSVVRRQLGAEPNPAGHRALALRGYAARPPGTDELYFAWEGSHGLAYTWAFPIGDGRTNVGFIRLTSRHRGGRRALEQAVAERLPQLPPGEGTLAGHTLPLVSHRPDPAPRRNALLVGDAASLINPLSGEGIYYALASGALAGEAAVAAADPGAAYRERLHARFGAHWRHVRLLARLLHVPGPVTGMLLAARHDPEALEALIDLALGDGTLTGRRLGRAARALARHPLAAHRAPADGPTVG